MPLSDWEKTQVLLKEYDALRAQILQYMHQRFQMLTIAGALGAFALFTAKVSTGVQQAALAVAAGVAITVWWTAGYGMALCGNRIAEIELQVNQLAGDGEDLLAWEARLQGNSILHRLHG